MADRVTERLCDDFEAIHITGTVGDIETTAIVKALLRIRDGVVISAAGKADRILQQIKRWKFDIRLQRAIGDYID